ncbi:hypothetical protein N9Y89_00020 [bacterium]|nr:hypothetical protein [bacterium]
MLKQLLQNLEELLLQPFFLAERAKVAILWEQGLFSRKSLEKLGLEHTIAIIGIAKRLEEIYFLN